MNITPAEKQEKANESFMTLLLIFLCGFKKNQWIFRTNLTVMFKLALYGQNSQAITEYSQDIKTFESNNE